MADLGFFNKGFKISEGAGGVGLIKLLYLPYVFGQINLRYKCRPISDAALCGI